MKQARTPGARMNAPARRDSASPRASAAASLAPPPYGIALIDAAAGVSGPGGALPHAARIQAAFGPAHDVSSIRAHVGGAAAVAAARLGAEAYATGNQIAFARSPSLHTAAHEAAHVVQQRAGVQLLGGVGEADDTYERNADAVADRVVAGRSAADLLPEASGARGAPAVQLRRLPGQQDLARLLAPGLGAADALANVAAVRRLIELAEAELTAPERVQVETGTLAGMAQGAFDALPEPTRLTRRVRAILGVRPDLRLGDPGLIDTGPRSDIDAQNIQTLVTLANEEMKKIDGGKGDTGQYDADLDQVFGPARRAEAKQKYKNARTWLLKIFLEKNAILSDRSGFSKEVGYTGITIPEKSISLSPDIIDKPTAKESIVTMIHEAVHSGNQDVQDKGYIGSPAFEQLSEEVKITNAAHFEIVPRRILGASWAFKDKTFTPAGAAAASGGGATQALSSHEQALRAASEYVRTAWNMGLSLHRQIFARVYSDPALWYRGYRHGVLYWSKVERLTIHRKTGTDPTSTNPARRPISLIDLALSEGVTRKLSRGTSTLGQVSTSELEAWDDLLGVGFEVDEIWEAEERPETTRDLWIRYAILSVGGVTGTGTGAEVERDLRVVHELYNLGRTQASWRTALDKRDLGDFPD